MATIDLRLPTEISGLRIQRRLGEGGMGTVYEAQEVVTQRRVALKILPRGQLESRESRERFAREARVAASISHPNCVFVYGVHEIEGLPAISMELLPGATLADHVLSGEPEPIHIVVGWMLQVVDGLEAASKVGVLHRDVKPANCFLCVDGRVKVGDFGLARVATEDTTITQTGTFIGTPLFASPEQVRGRSIDLRSDIYGVGATLYALLTGVPAFHGGDVAATLVKILTEEPADPRRARAEIPAALSGVVLKAMSKDAADRFQSYDELRHALRPFASATAAAGALASTSQLIRGQRVRDAQGQLGRFEVESVVASTAKGKLLKARDPKLERSVWIHLYSPLIRREELPAARTDEGAAAAFRVRLIESVREARASFDVYEAVSGAALRSALQRGTFASWANAHALLIELCTFLGVESQPVHLEQLWIDGSGRLRVLDVPLSVCPEAASTGVALVSKVANEILMHAPQRSRLEGATTEATELVRRLAKPDATSGTTIGKLADQLRALAAVKSPVSVAHRVAQGLVAIAPTSALLAARAGGAIAIEPLIALAGVAGVALLAIVAAMILRGSISLQLFKLRVRNVDGREAPAMVCGARACAAWMPLIAAAAKFERFTPLSLGAQMALGACLAALIAHAILIVRDPSRGLFERLTQTRVAPN